MRKMADSSKTSCRRSLSSRALQVMAEGLLDYQPAPARAVLQAGRADALRRQRVLADLGGKIEEHVAAGLAGLVDLGELLSDALEQRDVAKVARDIMEALGKRLPEIFIQLGVFGKRGDRVLHLVAKLIVGENRARSSHDG